MVFLKKILVKQILCPQYIQLPQNREYFGISQLNLEYKQTLQLKFRGIELINGNYNKHVGHSVVNGIAP